MQTYQCHKRVKAGLIVTVATNYHQDECRIGIGGCGGTITLDTSWYEKHKPEVGGYLVEYEDGYRSYSPAKAFEEGYTLVEDQA